MGSQAQGHQGMCWKWVRVRVRVGNMAQVLDLTWHRHRHRQRQRQRQRQRHTIRVESRVVGNMAYITLGNVHLGSGWGSG